MHSKSISLKRSIYYAFMYIQKRTTSLWFFWEIFVQKVLECEYQLQMDPIDLLDIKRPKKVRKKAKKGHEGRKGRIKGQGYNGIIFL